MLNRIAALNYFDELSYSGELILFNCSQNTLCFKMASYKSSFHFHKASLIHIHMKYRISNAPTKTLVRERERERERAVVYSINVKDIVEFIECKTSQCTTAILRH